MTGGVGYRADNCDRVSATVVGGGRSIKGRAAMAGGVRYRANNCDRVSAAIVGRRRSVEGPGVAKFNRLVRVAASNHRGGGVHNSHFLAALSAIAAKIGGLPDPRRIKGGPAMAGGVGHCADNSDCISA